MSYLKDLYFGMADADNDFTSNPERFHRTYLDRWDLPNLIASHQKCLLLGPKGSGKSAGALYVAYDWQRAQPKHQVIRTFVDFDELNRTQSPLRELDNKLVGGEVLAMSDAAWKIFIGTRLLDSLYADPNCTLYKNLHVENFMKKLQEHGLASDDYPSVLRTVRQRRGTISPIPNFISGELTSTPTDNMSPIQLADAIFRLVRGAQSPNRHILAIDGLDKAIGQNPAYWQTLAALIRVVDRFRKQLRDDKNQAVYVLVMCRSDVFRRVRFSDAAKIGSDSGVRMEWASESDEPLSVLLWEYISRKAEISTAGLLDLLPRNIDVGRGDRSRPIKIEQYILQFTRYTPRDMTLLFDSIKERASGQHRASSEQVSGGADSFASNHLLAEIGSEATGLLPDNVADGLEDIVGHLPSRIFTRDEFEKAIEDAGIQDQGVSTEKLAEYLFLQGAIGNYKPGIEHYQFYHRRQTHKFARKGPWALHYGLRLAFNVPWGRQTSLNPA